jgi:hypothetical protein
VGDLVVSEDARRGGHRTRRRRWTQSRKSESFCILAYTTWLSGLSRRFTASLLSDGE